MTPEQADLSRRLAGLPGFRWVRGMRADVPGDVGTVVAVYWTDADKDGHPCGQMSSVYVSYDEETRACEHPDHDLHMLLPNLTDDATGGVLFGWLCALDEDCAVRRSSDGLRVTAHGRDVTGSTLAEACARALVAMGRCA